MLSFTFFMNRERGVGNEEVWTNHQGAWFAIACPHAALGSRRRHPGIDPAQGAQLMTTTRSTNAFLKRSLCAMLLQRHLSWFAYRSQTGLS